MTADGATGVPDPLVRRWLERAAELAAEAHDRPWPDRQTALEVSDRLFAEFGAMPPDEVAAVEHRLDLADRALRVREYRSVHRTAGAVVLLHGGGFAFGSITEQQNVATARGRARGTGAAVFDVEYRLAPDAPFPAAVEDVVDVVTHLHEAAARFDIDGDRIVLDGVSAGAGLAAAAALELTRAGDSPLCGLVLEIPSIDLRPSAPWVADFARDSGLAERSAVRDYYLRGADPTDPRASPAAGDLSRMPRTHVITAEFDPLRAAGEDFVDRLRVAGVSVTATRHLGAAHGSHNLTAVSRDARLWHDEVDAAIRDFMAERRALKSVSECF